MRMLSILFAALLALVCLIPATSATYSSFGRCMWRCRRLYRRGYGRACYCRMNCLKTYITNFFDADNPLVCYYRNCAYLQCYGAYYHLCICRNRCYDDYNNRKTTTPAPIITTSSAATTLPPLTSTAMPSISPTTATEGIVVDLTTEGATNGAVDTSTFSELTMPTTTEATTTEATTTEATTTEATTTEEVTTTEATTTEATTTEATTTEAITSTEVIEGSATINETEIISR